MAASTKSFTLLFLVLLITVAQVANAGRKFPAKAKSSSSSDDKKQTDCLNHEGTVLIPGVGRYMIGSHHMPDISGLDHSFPAAIHSQYMPGNDDTFVPNPGFEVPNPVNGVIP